MTSTTSNALYAWAARNHPFFSYGTSYDELDLGDLDNAIHPVFREQNFPADAYDTLRPVLRLASQLITTECLLPFWHAMFFGLENEVEEESRRYEVPMFQFRRPENRILPSERTQTKLAIFSMGPSVRFHPVSEGPEEDGLGSAYRPDPGAITYTLVDENLPSRFPGGCGSRIYYVDEKLEELRAPANSYITLQRRFLFAVALIHELTHVAHNAVTTNDTSFERWFEDEIVGEVGYSWENLVFGGRIDYCRFERLSTLTVTEGAFIPPRITRISKKADGKLLVDPENDDLAIRGDIPPNPVEGHPKIVALCERPKIAWAVPVVAFVQRLFTKRFWDEVVPREGAAAFRPVRRFGYGYGRDETGPWRFGSAAVPDGYRTLGNGLIIPEELS